MTCETNELIFRIGIHSFHENFLLFSKVLIVEKLKNSFKLTSKTIPSLLFNLIGLSFVLILFIILIN
jgi:hypothetical protein